MKATAPARNSTTQAPVDERASRSLSLETRAPAPGASFVRHRIGDYSLLPLASQAAPIQRVLTHANAHGKADRLQKLHADEREYHRKLNVHLATYSHAPTDQNYGVANDGIKALRTHLNAIHNEMADLTAEYAATGDQGHRQRFMQRFLGQDYSPNLEARFKNFSDRTELDAGDQSVEDVHKNRFLAHNLQNLKYATGRGRFNELMDNIDVGRGAQDPKRKIKIATMNFGAPKAGLANDQDVTHGHKTDQRDEDADQQMLGQAGENLTEFIRLKGQVGDQRTANANRRHIGDLKVYMDRGQMVGQHQDTLDSPLVPMYYGHDNQRRVVAYTSPMHATIHHELGHLTNSLKGIEGPVHDKYAKHLGPLTNEEELYNVHLDPHSDKTLSTEMNLPTRIAHQAFGGLDSATPDLPQQVMEEDLSTWDRRTHNVQPHRGDLLQAIKSSVDSGEWSRHTRGFGARPSAVAKIRGRTGQIPQSGTAQHEMLEAIKQHATTARQGKGLLRKAPTTAFYQVLSGMDLSTAAGLRRATQAVDRHRQVHL